jgi:hypothetical protein
MVLRNGMAAAPAMSDSIVLRLGLQVIGYSSLK